MVLLSGTWQTCYRANLESRIASRILWQIARDQYRNETDIYDLTRSRPGKAGLKRDYQ